MLKKFILPIIATLALSACTYNIDNSKSTNNLIPAINASNLDIDLENAEILNTESVTLGTVCSAHKYKINLGDDLEYSLTALDKNNTLNSSTPSDVSVIASTSNSTLKCIIVSAMSGKCQANVTVSGQITSKRGGTKPFSLSKESIAPTIACEGARNSLQAASAEIITDIVSMVTIHDK